MEIYLGFSSSLGANVQGCEQAPAFCSHHLGFDLYKNFSAEGKPNDVDAIAKVARDLAKACFELSQKGTFFVTLGGDHTSAIGTWSGMAEAKRSEGDIGLLWIDAHMDSHTPATSHSGNVHGMALAVLLGYGDKRLTTVLSPKPKIKPEHVALLGVRSYEEEEVDFLNELGVRVYFMEEIKKRGLRSVWQEALEITHAATLGYGISLDLDSLDPLFAAAVDTPEPHGLDKNELLACLRSLSATPPLAFELVEYNPILDSQLQTLATVQSILEVVTLFF